MEPRIQYAQTKDGVSIAFYTLGEGMPVVDMSPLIWSHVEWQRRHWPDERRWTERLAEKRQVISYDGRGSGLSEREVSDFSLESFLLDLDAVVGHLGLERFALLGGFFAGPLAITYAARHPETVSHLILWHSWARTPEIWGSQQFEEIRPLAEKDWELFTQAAGHVLLGWEAGEDARRFAAYMRESIAPDLYQAHVAARNNVDVGDLLPQVRAPTLVLHRRQVSWPPLDFPRELASRIPEARLVILEGTSVSEVIGDMESVLDAIDEFLSEDEEAAAKAESPEPGAFRTILFTDVEGSTALTQRLGDAKARELLRQHERMVREALKAHGGSEVKTMGDGFLASFSSATKALECAIAMQRAFAEQNESAEGPILVRVGLNAGEPIAEDEDLFGTAVNRAARIAALAQGGEILVANVVSELAEGKEFMFGDRGETALRGFDDPVRLFEVRWRE